MSSLDGKFSGSSLLGQALVFADRDVLFEVLKSKGERHWDPQATYHHTLHFRNKSGLTVAHNQTNPVAMTAKSKGYVFFDVRTYVGLSSTTSSTSTSRQSVCVSRHFQPLLVAKYECKEF